MNIFKGIVQVLCALLFMASCQEAIKKKAIQKEEPASLSASYLNRMEPRNANSNTSIRNPSDIIGYWVGEFDPDMNDDLIKDLIKNDQESYKYYRQINLSIDSISSEFVFAHSIVSGKRRPLSGSFKKQNNTYTFLLIEPGDDQFDGKFEFVIKENDSQLNGTWKAFGDVKMFSRVYSLRKVAFQYDPNYKLEIPFIDGSKMKESKTMDGEEEMIEESYFMTTENVFKYQPNLVELKQEDVEGMVKGDIYILRNSIYARHGYAFKSIQLADYFREQSWYLPIKSDIKKELSVIERKNVALLLRYEKNAEEYYDVFGR